MVSGALRGICRYVLDQRRNGRNQNILNVGTLIIMIQAIRWAKQDVVAIRRGEFYELILLTLFGMYLMISSRHFLLFRHWS